MIKPIQTTASIGRLYQTKRAAVLVAVLFISITSFGQSPDKLWENKWDVNFFADRKGSFSNDSKYFAIGAQNGSVTIYEAATGNIYDIYSLHDKQVFCSVFQPGGTLIASGDKEGALCIYDYISKTRKFVIDAHHGALTTITFSADGHLLITGSRDHSIGIWDPATGKLLSRIENVKGNILSVRITPQNKTLVVGTTALSKGLRIFDVQSGEQLAALESANLQNLDLSPDGKFIATANLEKVLTIWDLFQYREVFAINGHTRNINDVAYDPAGRYLASSSDDRTVIIWDLERHVRKYTINGSKAMRGLSYSPDGRYLATMNEDGKLCVWDVSTLSVISRTDIEEIGRLPFGSFRRISTVFVINERFMVPIRLPPLPPLEIP